MSVLDWLSRYSKTFFLFLIGCLLAGITPSVQASQALEVGFRTLTFPEGTGVDSATGQMPESKLWYHDSTWWGVLWSEASSEYRIHSLDEVNQDWIETPTAVDSRNGANVDVLWDGSGPALYVLSHLYSSPSELAVSAAERARLYRYGYDHISRTYTLAAGFPVDVADVKTKSMVLDKDSTGRLWVTYNHAGTIMVNASGVSDSTWDPVSGPFVLPVGDPADARSKDLASITSFGTDVGVVWGNSRTDKFYVAIHPDGSAPGADWTAAIAFDDAGAESVNDHLNLATLGVGDPAGTIFAAIKTSELESRIMLLVCSTDCATDTNWSAHTVFTSSANVVNPTRPIVVLDPGNRHVYVIATARDANGERDVYYKVANLDGIYFDPATIGTPMIKDDAYSPNDITSTKQTLTAGSGLAGLASNSTSYFHNQFIPPAPAPSIVIDKPSHNYGGVALGGSDSIAFEVGNTGTLDLVVSSSTLIGANALEFMVESGGGGVTLSPGKTHEISVSFNPVTPGPKTASLRIASNDPNDDPLDIPLSGIGGLIPDIAVTPATVNFGDKVVGGTVFYTIEVRNEGTSTLTVASSSLSGTDSNKFTIDGGGGAFALEPDESRDLRLSFTPDAVRSFSATLELVSDDPDESTKGIAISGTGIAAPPSAALSQEVETGGATASSVITTGAPLTGATDNLYLAAIAIKSGLGVLEISGLGLTWSEVTTQCSGDSKQVLSIWKAEGTSSTYDGAVTATLIDVPSTASMAVTRYSGVTQIGAVVSANTNGVSGGCELGSDSSAYAYDLTTTAPGAMLFSAVAMRQRIHKPSDGFIPLAEVREGTGGIASSVAVLEMTASGPRTVTVDGTFNSSTDWVTVGLELQPVDSATHLFSDRFESGGLSPWSKAVP